MGAKLNQWYSAATPKVSIHAPVMGANLLQIFIFLNSWVSIHAPVMGAKVKRPLVMLIFGFNPRTRDGCELR